MLDERGAYIIIIARFIPGGRIAVTFSSGYIPTFPWRRFIVYDVAAGCIWASYAALLGYFGGKTFENHPFVRVADRPRGRALARASPSRPSGTTGSAAPPPEPRTIGRVRSGA